MIIIGEKLNSSIPSVLEAMKNGEDAVIALAKAQEDAGATFLDINTAMFAEDEYVMMEKTVRMVLENTSCGIMLDSPDPDVLIRAAKLCEGRELIFNSVTADERIDVLAPEAAKLGCGIVVLPMDENGIPDTVEGRLDCAKIAIAKLTNVGVSEKNIYIDAICETLATDDQNARKALDTIARVKSDTEVKTTCGLSNVSFGLPKRPFVNAAFLSTALYLGLDSAILDPTSKELRKALFAGAAIAGRDEFCMEYIGFVRGEY